MAITHIWAMFANNIPGILEFSREQNKELCVTILTKNTDKLPKVTASVHLKFLHDHPVSIFFIQVC